MKHISFIIIALSISTLMLSGCTHHRTTKILKADQAQVAITLNKGFEATVISTNDGKRIAPTCVTDTKLQKTDPPVPLCNESDFSAKGDNVLYEQTYRVVVKEGSVCIKIKIGTSGYELCDPPLKFNF